MKVLTIPACGKMSQRVVQPAMEILGLRHEVRSRQTGECYVVSADCIVIPHGKLTLVKGPSGSGKSTLLQLLGLATPPWRRGPARPVESFLVYEPCCGVTWDVWRLWQWVVGRRCVQSLRCRLLGFCLQKGELVGSLTVHENVALPLHRNRWARPRIATRVKELLVALSNSGSTTLWRRRLHYSGQLSGGEYQRVALARALAHAPQIVLLDEPTSSIDRCTSAQAIKVLQTMQRQLGLTVVLVSHDDVFLQFADFLLEMSSPEPGLGRVVGYQRRDERGQWIATDNRWQPIHRSGET